MKTSRKLHFSNFAAVTVFITFILLSGSSFAEHINDSRSPEGQRPKEVQTANGLVPSGVGGNPGFSFLVAPPSGYGPSASCQGTLVSVEKNVCTVATASHCLQDDLRTAKKRGRAFALNKPWCKPELRNQVVQWGELTIDTADFGTVKAIGMIHPEASKGSPNHDTAVFYFQCPEGAGKVPVVKVDPRPLKAGEEIRYGKIRRRLGLFIGRVFGKRLRAVDPSGREVFSTQEGNERDLIDQDDDKTIIQGDSGGPGLIYRDGEWKLGAILSGFYDAIGPTKALYQTGNSLDFVACMAGATSTSSDSPGESTTRPPNPLLGSAGGGASNPSPTTPKPRIGGSEGIGSGVSSNFNGYEFRPNEESGGLHAFKPGENPSSENAIFLKRMPDGTRRAAKKDGEGNITILSDDVQNGLKQYYSTNQDKVSRLPDKQKRYVEDFLRGSAEKSQAGPTPSQTAPESGTAPASNTAPKSNAAPTSDAAAAIDKYENGMRYPTDGSPREYFPPDTFKDIPKGGTGQIILAYFGPKDPQLEEAGKKHPYIDVRNYPYGSPEHRHARLFGTQALGLDGLGRKITRYAMSPREAFNSLASSDEVGHLKRYLDAKKQGAATPSEVAKPSEPITPDSAPRSGQSNGVASGSAPPSGAPSARPDSQPAQPAPHQAPAEPPRKPASHPPVDAKGAAAILEGKCVTCHKNTASLDPSLKTTSGLLEHLKSATDGTLEEMGGRAGLSAQELQELKNFRDSKGSSSAHSGSPNSSRVGEAQKREVASSGAVDACYMSNSERQARIEALPQFDTEGSPIASSVNSALTQGRAVFYDNKSVPLAWQNSKTDGRIGGEIYSERYHSNMGMYDKMGYHSDGNREFPWKGPAGTDASGNTVDSEKFFIPSSSGQLASAVTRNRQNSPSYYGKTSNVSGPDLGWVFEAGATFGEVLKVKDPETGESIPFEIRLRKKNNDGVWQMDVMRPFENATDLLAGLKKLCIENKNPPSGCATLNWSSLEKPNIQVFNRSQFVNQRTVSSKLDPLKLSTTAATALPEKAALQVLPNLPPDVVRALLKTTPFKSVFGKPWNAAQSGGAEGWAPTSGSDFNIVPKNYFGGFIAMNQVSCMKCHESAGRHVDNFDPKRDPAAGIVNDPGDATRSRTWYNFIRGNDGILSFHPFDPSKVARAAPATTQSFRDCLKRSGLFK